MAEKKEYDTILIKRGLLNNMPRLKEGEFGLAKDAKRLFIGTSDGNYEVMLKKAEE